MYCKRIKDFFASLCFPLIVNADVLILVGVSFESVSKFCRNSVGSRIVKFEGPREIKA